MSYQLGIDFGTTFTAAAVRRADGTGEPEVVPLGGRGGAVPSVLHLARDERVTVGEAAAGLAGIDPTRVVRALKRRVGDPEPVVLGGHPWTAEDLSARLLRWVVDRVAEHEGGPPARIALAHPAVVVRAHARAARRRARRAGPGRHVRRRAARGGPRRPARRRPGDTVGVYDLGGGRFDAAVLRREGPPAGGFAILGVPETIADLGGLDLDELVWQHVRAALPDDVSAGRAGPARVHPGEGDAQRRGRGRRADPARRSPRRRPAGPRHVRGADRAARRPDGGRPAPHDRVGRAGARRSWRRCCWSAVRPGSRSSRGR